MAQTSVRTLDHLIAELTAPTSDCGNAAKVAELFRSHPIPEADFAASVEPSPRSYSRNLLYRNDDFELLLIRWATGARSPIHDHHGQRCFMLVRSGTLMIDDYDLISGGREPGAAHLLYARSTEMMAGAIDLRTTERDIHLIESRGPSESLHLYAKPIDTCLTFDLIAQTCAYRENRYDSVRPGARVPKG